MLLVFDEHSICPLQIVDLDVQSVDVALQCGDVCLRCVDSALAFVTILSSHVQLLIEGTRSVNQLIALLFEY